MEQKPCCTAEALRRVNKIQVDGKTMGTTWPEPIHGVVAALNLAGNEPVAAEQVRRVKVYNYLSWNAEKACAWAVFEEYKRHNHQNRIVTARNCEEPR